MTKEKTVVKLPSSVEEKIIDKVVDLSQYIGEITFYPYQLPFARRLTESIITNEGATLSALFSRQCITENSFIMDRNGNVTQIKNHPDAWKAKESSDSIYEIKTFGGHVIYCTEEHPIFTENGWTPAQCVEKGMKVVVLDQWDRFGDGVIQYNNKSFTINDDLAELVGWLTANIKGEENVEIVIGHTRVKELLNKYFPDTKVLSTKSKIIVTLTGKLKLFLKNIIKYSKEGIPYALNNFTKQQLILFFYPLFLTNGKIYRKINSIKIVLKDNSRPRLLFYKEHLNKLGLHGNQEVWIGQNLSFQCATNYDRFKELFSDYLPTNYFVPYFKNRERKLKTFVGEDGEILKYSKVHSVKKIEDWPYPVWDINVPDKGWFLASGIKVHNSGKCLAKGTEIVMYDGTFKKVEDVCVGDKLLTPDSKSVKVTSTVNGKDTMYKISPTMKNQQDASYTVNSAHILSLYNTKTKQIEDINVLEYINSPNKINYRGIRAVAYFPKRKTYIAPYFLGLWLGDGDSRDTRITNVDKEIVDYLYEYAANLNMKISTYSYSNRTPSYSITSKEDSTRSYSNQHRVNIIRKEMEHLNLFGNKHIPEDYLCNSYENRMQLLAGLIDSDGSLDKHQVRYEISCSNNILCEQIVRLARSLGFQVTLSKRVTSCNKKDFVSNRIVIYGEIWKIPVRVARKKAPKGSIKKNPLLYKIKVEEVGLGEYCGFTLDNKEKRFLLKDFTITHNTQIVAMITAALMIILPTLADKYPENFSIFQKGFWAGCFGPVGEQAVTMFDRIYEVFTTDSCKQLFIEELKMPIPSRGGARGNLIRLQNKSFVRYMSGSKRAKVESKTYHLIILDECLSGDTEVLTPEGWIRIDSWNGQSIALLNDNFEVSYEVPNRYIAHDNVPLITAKCKHGLDYTTTAGHRIVYASAKNPNKIKTELATNFWERGNQGCRAIRSGILNGTYNLTYLDRIGIMLNADGCKYYTNKDGVITWKLEFSKKRKLNRCKYLLKKEGIDYKVSSKRDFNNPNWNSSTKITFKLSDVDYKEDFRSWLPYNCGRDFVKELLHWDGSRKTKTKEYDSKLLSNVEFVEQICLQSGINCSPIRTIVRKNKKHSTIYRLDIGWKHGFAFGRNNKSLEITNGPAYCFETTTGMFFIRKNGVVLTTGNCQDIDSFKIRKSINPMGAAVNATTVATGTPDVYIGYFYDTIEQNKSFDLKNPSAKQSHFEVDYSIAQKYNAYYKKYIQKEIKRLGFDSDEFKMAYRLIWPITKGMVFTKSQLEEKCYDKSLKIVTTWKETPCIAGLDLGKSQDSTVVTVIKPIWGEEDEEGNMPKVLLNWLEIEGDEWEDQYPQVIEFLSNYNIETLICDTTGVGDPIRERYTVLLPSVNVGPFTFSPSSKDRGYKYLIQEINSKRLVIPAHYSVRKTNKFKKFENQMTTLKKNYSGKFLNPCPIDKDKGHDDYCLSEDTEILTARGFVGIDDIHYTDLVVNYNLNGTLTYSNPKKIIKDTYKEYMVSLEGPYVSQLLTNNHKILYEYLTSNNNKNCYKQAVGLSQYALERTPNSTFRLVCSGIQDQPEYDISDEEIQLAAWMITEGWISKSKKWNDARYQLGQSEKVYPEKVNMIDSLVNKLNLSYNRYIRKDGLVIWQFRKINKLFFDNLLLDGIHTIPRNWLSFFSRRQLQLLLDTLMLGDGTISRNTYNTKDKNHAKDIQELVFRLGKQATISFQKNKKSGIYNIYIRDNHIFGTLNSINKINDYTGRTWCVAVDSGFIVIRRNEKISITGNCDSLMLAVFGTYFEILPEIEVTQNDIFIPPRNNAEQLFGRNYSRVQKTSRW